MSASPEVGASATEWTSGRLPNGSPPQRTDTPPRSGPAPVRLLRVCLNNAVLGGVEVSEASTLADVRESIAEDEIQGVPESYVFLYGGAPVTRRQESRRRALVCFPVGFLTIIPENALIEQPRSEAAADSAAADAADGGVTPASSSAGGPHGATFALPSGAIFVADAAASSDVEFASGDYYLELHITEGPLEGTTVTVGEEGARLGRHTSNSLVIPEASISRYHCEISIVDGNFCIRDLGSVTGTFFYLKPHGHFKMFPGLMVKLGETELKVLSQGPAEDDAGRREQVVHFHEGPLAGHKVYVPESGICMGRRSDNQLVLMPDVTISARHAAIFFEEGEFYLADLGSCNGTCVRMSTERGESDWHPIMDGDVVGAGCTKMLCRLCTGAARAAQS